MIYYSLCQTLLTVRSVHFFQLWTVPPQESEIGGKLSGNPGKPMCLNPTFMEDLSRVALRQVNDLGQELRAFEGYMDKGRPKKSESSSGLKRLSANQVILACH